MNDAVAETLLAARPAVPPAPPRRRAVAWSRRVRSEVGTYLPLLLLGLVALGSWWLVKNTPMLEAERPAAALRHVPDYTMTNFTVQRFAAGGGLRTQLEGDVLRHYPDTDTLEIDNPRIRANAPNGNVTLASARTAVSNGDASEVQLSGDARVLRQAAIDATDAADTLEFRGEFLHAYLNTEQLRSNQPVTVTRGNTQLRGDSMDYDHLERVVQLKGRVRATFAARLPASAAPKAKPPGMKKRWADAPPLCLEQPEESRFSVQ